ncbi:hypothetical protein [Actinoplanes sp. NPDC048796]|uniref:hypothetical protein n=1 Tax=unclassified Actinoplanes TaxID=2626549 RepID=UPI0033C419BB
MSYIPEFDDDSDKSDLDILAEAILDALRSGVLSDHSPGIHRPGSTVAFEPGLPPTKSLLN